MKKYISLFVILVGMSVLLTGCGSVKLSDAFDKDTVEKAAEQTIEYINDGDYDSVCAMFDDDMKVLLSADKLKEGVEKTIGDPSTFVEYKKTIIIGQKVEDTGEDSAVAVVVAKYEKKNATYTISFDTDMKIIGIYLK
jgi:hypothetical protein